MAGDVKHARELIAEAGKHAEGQPQRCDCGRPGCDMQTYCTWCGNEWPCLPRELADALEAALPGDDDFEYAHRDGGAWTDLREDALYRAGFLGTKPVRRRKAGPVEPLTEGGGS